MKKLSEVLTFL